MMTQDQSTWPRRRAKPCFRICNFVSIDDWRDGMRAEMQDLEPNISKEERELADIAPSSDDYKQRLAALNELKNNVNGLSFATEGKARYPEAMEAEGAENVRGLDLVGEIDTGWKAFDQWASKAIGKANKNPDLLLYKLQSNGCKFAWLLVPLSIALIWLVTLGRRRDHFYDQAVGVTYSIAFMSLLFIVATLSVKSDIVPSAVIPLAVVFAPLHMYRQLRHAYHTSRLGAVLRLSVLLVCISFVVTMFLLALIGLGMIG